MAKSTPGPWHVDKSDDTEVFSADSCNVATAWTFGHGESEVRSANARLIAAAPQLLEALKQAKYWIAGREPHDSHCAFICNGGGECDCHVPEIDAAIKLAEGEL